MKLFRYFVFYLIFISSTINAENPISNCRSIFERICTTSLLGLREADNFFRTFPDLALETLKVVGMTIKINNRIISPRVPEVREAVLCLGEKLEATGYLPGLIRFAFRLAFRLNQLPPEVTKDSLDYYSNRLISIITGELASRGKTRNSKSVIYQNWSQIGQGTLIRAKQVLSSFRLLPGQDSLFKNPDFVSAFQNFSNTKLTSGNEVRLLIDGPASFAEREKLIKEAKSAIHISVWAWYDDITGKKFSDLLIARKKEDPSLDIRILVDGQNAQAPAKQACLNHMEREGIQVIRFNSTDPSRPIDGHHRKIMTVDNRFAILGGMNFGDEYSHLGPDNIPKWRDTDLLVKGPSVADIEEVIINDWNSQLAQGANSKSSAITPMSQNPIELPVNSEGVLGGLTNHSPGQAFNIYRANILAIEAASKSIDIENAYLILDPGTFKALIKAKKRGVRVRIFTNSPESTDVPEMMYTMTDSINRLIKAGVEVYGKQGPTLHTKGMNVDGVYSYIGSHNLHPRSVRYENETVYTVIDGSFGSKMLEMMEMDYQQARKISQPISLPKSKLGAAISYWLFDQL